MPKVMGKSVHSWLDGRINKALATFEAAELTARRSAAKTATTVTRQAATRDRPKAPPRPGRPQINLAAQLKWKARADTSEIEFDIDSANRNSRFWIVQEIGTDAHAVLRRGHAEGDMARTNPAGRPKRGSDYTRKVKTQYGRFVGAGLAFGTGPKGRYSRPGSARGQQIYVLRNLSDVPVVTGNRGQRMMTPRIMIRREIPGKRMVHYGSIAGFRQYEQEVLAAAQQMRRNFQKA